jgi:hypothetical protein
MVGDAWMPDQRYETPQTAVNRQFDFPPNLDKVAPAIADIYVKENQYGRPEISSYFNRPFLGGVAGIEGRVSPPVNLPNRAPVDWSGIIRYLRRF